MVSSLRELLDMAEFGIVERNETIKAEARKSAQTLVVPGQLTPQQLYLYYGIVFETNTSLFELPPVGSVIFDVLGDFYVHHRRTRQILRGHTNVLFSHKKHPELTSIVIGRVRTTRPDERFLDDYGYVYVESGTNKQIGYRSVPLNDVFGEDRPIIYFGLSFPDPARSIIVVQSPLERPNPASRIYPISYPS